MICPACGEALRRAVYRDGDAIKSCPRCSTRAGRHVFYTLGDFGERHPHGGEAIIQSWCRECRSDRPPGTPAGYCVVVEHLPQPPAAPPARSSQAG